MNAIAPGPTLTPANETVGAAFIDQMTRTLPAGRAPSPSEIADAAVNLASPESNFVHGITLHVDAV